MAGNGGFIRSEVSGDHLVKVVMTSPDTCGWLLSKCNIIDTLSLSTDYIWPRVSRSLGPDMTRHEIY